MIDRRQFLLGAGACLAGAGFGCAGSARAPARSDRVVVVGAGLSGLVVAHDLRKRGLDVLVLEASAIPGGRVRTVRTFRDGLHVEAGATHVVGDPDLVGVIDELGVEQAAPVRAKLARVRFFRGERRVFPAGAPVPDDGPTLTADEESLGEEGRMQHYFGLAEKIDPRARSWPEDLRRVDRVSVATFLRAQGASPGFIARLEGMLPLGDGIESVSALSALRELASIRAEIRGLGARSLGRIAGGTDRLPRALAARLGERIAYRTQVRRIEHRPDGAVLVVTDPHGTHRIDAARVVLTMPMSVMRAMEVAPTWSQAKRRAIASLGMTSVTRLWVESDRRFWIERGESGTAETDLDIGRVKDETEGQPGKGGVLGGYLSGSVARRYGARGAARALEDAAADIERVHPGMRDHVVGGAMVDWDREPFARGAYPFFAPGQLSEHAAAASAPEGVVHFAGDGTSHRPGFMHGAVASAKRVVREILEASRVHPAP